MIRMHPTPPISAFNHLLGALAKINHHHHVVSCYTGLNSIALVLDIMTFNILLNCCCYIGRICNGLSILGKILRGGCSPDAFTFNNLIRGLCVKQKIGEATGLFRKMTVFGCQPDVITYGIVVNALCKHRMVEKAKQLFSKMKDGGISTNVIVYSSLLHRLRCMGNLDEAKGLFFVEMLDEGVQPNVVTYNVLIDVLYEGVIEDAQKLVDLMIQRGISPDENAYTSLLHSFYYMGNVDEAKALFIELLDEGV
ncbi:hypothetical protein SLE2022_261460 [Rubroshorea leprosula]